MVYFIILLILLRLLYWLIIFIRLAAYKPMAGSLDDQPGVSIVICIKNNVELLKVNLGKILKQNYPNYEVVIVDDFSTDGLKKYLDELNHPLIKYIHCSQDLPGKKQAVIDGVNTARYNWILQTDSDCSAASLDWIKWMMASRNSYTKIVLGVSPLRPQGGVISYIAAYESVYIAMQYLSYCLIGRPYMGVGRNILFEKAAFINANPYQDNIDLASGDDDFLVQNIGTKENTTICIEPNGFTYSAGPSSLLQYLKQKSRHLSTSHRYKAVDKYSLGIFALLHLGIYITIIIGLVARWLVIKQAIGLLLLMISIITIIQIPIFAKLRQRYLISWMGIGDVFLAGFYLYLSMGLFTKRNQTKWN